MCSLYSAWWRSQSARCSCCSFQFYHFTCNFVLRVVSLIFFSSYISFRFVPFHSVHFVRSFNANFRLRKLFRQKCNNRTEAKYFNCVSRNNGTCTTNKMTSTAHKMCVCVCVLCLAKKDGKNLLFRIHILQSS